MSNKFVAALKENKNDIRKKVLVTAAVTVGVVATAIVLSKMKDDATEIILVATEGAEALASSTTE